MEKIKHFFRIFDLPPEKIRWIIERGKELKEGAHPASYPDKIGGLLFEKPSTRTRVSFEVALRKLKAEGLYLSSQELQVSRGETWEDTGKVLSRYLHIVIFRTKDHNHLREIARGATIPVINALSPLFHPCQTLADLLTIRLLFGERKVTIAYLGDGNNVFHSLLEGAAICSYEVIFSGPEEFFPEKEIVRECIEKGALFHYEKDPRKAVAKADLIYTDVWVSMGQEEEAKRRKEILKPYQVNRELIQYAPEEVILLHCLPAHRGEEITSELLDSKKSYVFFQAENRLYAQMALLELFFQEWG
jgi:ornithine carbamoyltransferase